MKPAKLPIHKWAHDDRPREKLLHKGKDSLSDAELVAILIGSGNRDESAVDLAKRILAQSDNNLSALGKLSVHELMQFRGIGEAKAIGIAAALELGRRRKSASRAQKQQIRTSIDAYQLMSPVLDDLPHEEFWLLLLNQRNQLLSRQLVGRGGITATVADIRIIFKIAVEHLATSIIMVHNHPSGNLYPSKPDIELTNQAKSAGELLNIALLDHMIIGEGGFYSFADEGQL